MSDESAGGLQALCRMRRRHPHVDNRHVRPLAGDEREQPGHVLCLADDPEARRLERRRQRLAEQDRVVGKDDPDRVLGRGHGAGLPLAAGAWRKRIESTTCDAVAYQVSKVGGSPLQISIAMVAPSTSSSVSGTFPCAGTCIPTA